MANAISHQVLISDQLGSSERHRERQKGAPVALIGERGWACTKRHAVAVAVAVTVAVTVAAEGAGKSTALLCRVEG